MCLHGHRRANCVECEGSQTCQIHKRANKHQCAQCKQG
jgi:hypothetical protein